MFMNALQRQNSPLISAALHFWQRGKIMPDSYVIDVDRVIDNAKLLLAAAREHNITLYLMTKQVGRNPWLAKKLLALGYCGTVVVDYKEGRTMRRAGVRVAHQGHLVQIPSAQVSEVVEQGTDIITVFTVEKAREVSRAAVRAGRLQPIMLKVYGDGDVFYPGQEGGFAVAGLGAAVAEICQLPGVTISGLTHFPCLLWDESLQAVRPTANLHTLAAARQMLAESGTAVAQLNAPSATSCLTLPLLAGFDVTHAEPGHALTGTFPANQNGDQPEHVAVLWLSEVSHQFKGRSYCYGGGYYRRSQLRQALVCEAGAQTPVLTDVGEIDASSIDYYLPLEGAFTPGSAAIFCFRTQIFVTRSDVVLVAGIRSGNPHIVGRYTSLGDELEAVCRASSPS